MTSKLVPAEVLQGLRELDAPTISNAIEYMKVRDPITGYASLDIKCQFPDYKPMVGYAFTLTADSVSAGDTRPLKLAELLEAVDAAPKPFVVVCKHMGPDPLRSCFVGEMISMAFQRLGGVGVVSDCANRDITGIRNRAPGFHIFAPGWVVSHGHGTFLDMGINVSIGGLTIQQGDLLYGDENGLLQIPLDIAGAVLERARAVRQEEQTFFDWMDSPNYSISELKERLYAPTKAVRQEK